MLNGDVFVFDNVVHMYDLSDENLARPDSGLDRLWHLRIAKRETTRGPGRHIRGRRPHRRVRQEMDLWGVGQAGL